MTATYPHSPIAIVDRSPLVVGFPQSADRSDDAFAAAKRLFVRGALVAVIGAAAIGSFARVASMEPPAAASNAAGVEWAVPGEFRLGPGHAMPASLIDQDGVAGEFRLGPGNAMPAILVGQGGDAAASSGGTGGGVTSHR